MNKIISIQNSGESFEKSVALINTAIKSKPSFYSESEQYVFYGHNLPKKDCNINPHGTVGFYEEYFAKYEWCPIKNETDLLLLRDKFLSLLIAHNYITERNAYKLKLDDVKYIKFIRLIPMEILFSNLIGYIKERTETILPGVKFKKIFLENNFLKLYFSLPNEKWAYSIYALNVDGTVGHYYFNNLGKEKYYHKNLSHMFNELSKRPILSGNSALFLAAIQDISQRTKFPIGYRNHSREARNTRNFALMQLLDEREGIVEPKNTVFSKYFENILNGSNMSTEKMANLVIAKAYEDFLNENRIFG